MEIAPSFHLTPSLMPRSHSQFDRSSGPPPEVLTEIDETWGRAQRPLPDGIGFEFESEPALGRSYGVLRDRG
jgi:hypothetical protein